MFYGSLQARHITSMRCNSTGIFKKKNKIKIQYKYKENQIKQKTINTKSCLLCHFWQIYFVFFFCDVLHRFTSKAFTAIYRTEVQFTGYLSQKKRMNQIKCNKNIKNQKNKQINQKNNNKKTTTTKNHIYISKTDRRRPHVVTPGVVTWPSPAGLPDWAIVLLSSRCG